MLCFLFTSAPAWSNDESISLHDFAALIPLWEVPKGSPYTIIGDGGYGYGWYQIHQVMVDDYNRITGKDVAHEVAFDPAFSHHIAVTVLAHYAKHITSQGITLKIDHLLFIWNGGGNAWRRVENPINDKKQRNLERYKSRATPILKQYFNEQKKRRQSQKGTQI